MTKPPKAEAMHWDGTAEGATPIIDWILDSGSTAKYVCSNPDRCAETGGDTPHTIHIQTLEGDAVATAGDWIVRDAQGTFHPCQVDRSAMLATLADRWQKLADLGDQAIGHFEGPTAATLDAEVGQRSRTYRAAAADALHVLRTGRIPHDQ
jgi:hypothetical protein